MAYSIKWYLVLALMLSLVSCSGKRTITGQQMVGSYGAMDSGTDATTLNHDSSFAEELTLANGKKISNRLDLVAPRQFYFTGGHSCRRPGQPQPEWFCTQDFGGSVHIPARWKSPIICCGKMGDVILSDPVSGSSPRSSLQLILPGSANRCRD